MRLQSVAGSREAQNECEKYIYVRWASEHEQQLFSFPNIYWWVSYSIYIAFWVDLRYVTFPFFQ